MPELPEVETIKNDLVPKMVGHRLTKVTLLWPGSVRHPSPDDFCRGLSNQVVENIRRRGKYLLFDLGDGRKLIIHLKMTGCLLLHPSSTTPERHARAILHLDNGTRVHFLDQRKFGVMWLVDDENEVVGFLGPEPLDHRFSVWALRKALGQHKIPVKVLLCDQTAIAGIGNMYSDEALFEARINPLKKAGDLTTTETERLYRSIGHVLTEAIARSGASIATYQLPNGEPGFAHLFFQVAHRRGERCYRCNTLIKRISLRGRGTYFCPRCQAM